MNDLLPKEKFTFCTGKHVCPICDKTHVCDGVPYGHDNTKKGYRCHGRKKQYCDDCQHNRWDEVCKDALKK